MLVLAFSACGRTDDEVGVASEQDTETDALQSELEELQRELEQARLQLEYYAAQSETKDTGLQPEQESGEITEIEMALAVGFDVMRQELVERFAPANLPPVGTPPVGRWYRTFRDGNEPNWTGGYTMHEFHNDGTVRTYQRYWGSSDEGFLWQGTWRMYIEDRTYGNHQYQQTVVRVYHPDGTTRRFSANFSDRGGQGYTLIRTNEEGQFFSGWSFFMDVPPTAGWYYTQLAGVPIAAISGDWHYSDTIWPPSPDKERFFVRYEFGESGRLISHYHVRNDRGGSGPERVMSGRWSFSNNALHMHFDSGTMVSYTLQNGELHSANAVLQRELNICAEHQRAIATEEAQRDAMIRYLHRRFLGTWHFDASLWHFNDDGTGVVDIPALGINPQVYLPFTFEVMEAPIGYDAVLIMHYADEWETLGGTSAMLWVNFGTRSGGSMELGGGGREPVLLTRMFDINNTPFFDHQLETLMGIMDMIGNFVP